ncbi:MAG: Wadjet anti-phage system protein JetD domain-containing protein [Mycobacteriales bacterium]
MKVGSAGVQELPTAADIATAELALSLLDGEHRAAAAQYAEALPVGQSIIPEVVPVMLARPHGIIAAGDAFPLLLDVIAWMRAHPRPGVYARQIPVGGVHTKLIETHQPLLARLLNAALPENTVDPTVASFPGRYGLRSPARRVRVRGDAAMLGVPTPGAADVEWDIAALAAVDVDANGITQLLVVENKTSFLTCPAGNGQLTVWGQGYGADELLAALPWLGRVTVLYWGDIDTHGFTILNRVRRAAPHALSVLMDAETLVAHKAFWTREPTPHVEALTELTDAERALYEGLCVGIYGDRIRLEQELIRFDLIESAVAEICRRSCPS